MSWLQCLIWSKISSFAVLYIKSINNNNSLSSIIYKTPNQVYKECYDIINFNLLKVCIEVWLSCLISQLVQTQIADQSK